MIFNIFGRKRPVRDVIIEILSTEWPLSCRKIHWRLKRKYGISVTYQAVHKTVKQMVEEKVLAEEGKKYKINIDWAKKIEEFGRMVSKKYKNGSVNLDSNTLQISFNSPMEMFEFIVDGLCSNFFGDAKEIYSEVRHIPGPFTADINTLEKLKKIAKKSKFYILVRGNTILDRSFANLLSGFGVNIKTGIDCAKDFDLYVIGDTVIEIFFQDKYKKNMDKFYKKTRNILSFDMAKFYEDIIMKKTKMNVFIIRNPNLSETIRSRIKKKF